MRFCIAGKHAQLSLLEVKALLGTTAQVEKKGPILFFETPDTIEEAQMPGLLTLLAGCIKRGRVIEADDVEEHIGEKSLLGCNDKDQAMLRKRTYGLKRFKQVTFEHTDEEIRASGVELFVFDDESLGLVQGYQDIARFSAIDFEKPSRGMQIGMMPAKLAQLLMTLALGDKSRDTASVPTVYDPFCGFGTTGWVANSCGYHFIGSDSNITPAKQNLTRWKTTPYHHGDAYLTFFKQDVTTPLQKEFLKQVDAIVSEGWLGPVLAAARVRLRERGKEQDDLHRILKEIEELYASFLRMAVAASPRATIVITYPQYAFLPDNMSVSFQATAHDLGYTVEEIPEVYKRPGQQVQRRIIRLVPGTRA